MSNHSIIYSSGGLIMLTISNFQELKRIEEFQPPTTLLGSENADWEMVKQQAKNVEIYCSSYDFDNFVEHILLCGHGRNFSEYIATCIEENPNFKTFMFDGSTIVPLKIVE